MQTWYVKKLSKMTNVSVRALHYYDKIGLLKPSERLPNGYRVYTEKDVKKLEQIIALKFFGFTLARIKQILAQDKLKLEQLEHQFLLLQSEVSFLQEAQRNLLLASIKEYKKKASIDWHSLVVLINDYIRASKELAIKARRTLKESPPDTNITEQQEVWRQLLKKIHSYEQESS